MLTELEQARLRLSRNTEATKKSQFGQFFTSATTASFMAGLFPPAHGTCRLLDAGAGIGSLSAAFLDRCFSGGFGFQSVELDAFEIDATLLPHLNQALGRYCNKGVVPTVHHADFI